MEQQIANTLIFLSAAIISVLVFRMLKLDSVLGCFAGGIIIGPHGLGIVEVGNGINSFAELGVVFLLFAIGLELTVGRLRSMKIHVFGCGILQVVITSIVIGAIFYYFANQSPRSSAVIGAALCLSSTAIVLQCLRSSGKMSTRIGDLTLAILILQDFIVVPLLVAMPTLAGGDTGVGVIIVKALGKAAISMIIIFTCGRMIFRPIFNYIAAFQSEELFVAVTLFSVLGTAYLTEKAGMSMALGAFASGLFMAETSYRREIEQVIVTFKSLLLGLFFMTIGMSLNMNEIITRLPILSYYILCIILVKFAIIFFLANVFGFKSSHAIITAMLLAQSGEFSVVLLKIGMEQKIIESRIGADLLTSITVTMAVTPLLNYLGSRVNKFTDFLNRDKLSDDFIDFDYQVLLAGFGTIGYVIAKALRSEGISFAVLEINSSRAEKAKIEGYPVFKGDVSDPAMLRKLNVGSANIVVLALSNEVTIKKSAKIIHSAFPETNIVARVSDLENKNDLRKLGVSCFVPERYEEGLQITGVVMRIMGFGNTAISTMKEYFREDDYANIN